jgi:hypothetical protein
MTTMEVRKIVNDNEINNTPNVIYFQKDNDNFKCKISDQSGNNIHVVTKNENDDTVDRDFTGEVYIGQTKTFVITNFSAFKNYNLSAISGSVQLDWNEINYTAPNTPQETGFIINGKTIPITVLPLTLKAPTIAEPLNEATNVYLPVIVYSNGLEVNGPGGSTDTLTHVSSDWQLATDINFTNIVEQSLNDIISITGWSTSLATPNETYYVRVRHNTAELGSTPWSQPVMFSTVILLPIYDIQKLIGSDSLGLDLYDNEITVDNFGISSDIDYTGTRIIVGADGESSFSNKTGRVFIFKNNGSDVWLEETTIADPNAVTDNQFGYSISITDSGDRVAIGVPGVFNDEYSVPGTVYVYTRTGTSWVLEATLHSAISTDGDNFGSCVDFDANGNRLAISSYGSNSLNGIHIYVRTGTVWGLEQTLLTDTYSSKFGISHQLNADGSVIVAGAETINPEGIGEVYIFTRTGSVWTKQTTLIPSDAVSTLNFGHSVAINPVGNLICVNAFDTNLTYQKTYQFNYTTEWLEVAVMEHSVNHISHKISLGKNGNFLIAGYSAEANFDYTGHVYLYRSINNILPQTNLGNASQLFSPEPTIGKKFGYSVCVSGNGMVAFVTQTGNDYGAGFVYVTYSNVPV